MERNWLTHTDTTDWTKTNGLTKRRKKIKENKRNRKERNRKER
jgi:hypothetical protein